MSSKVKHIISFLLLVMFTAYITPKEIFHAFTHHTDSEHHEVNAKDGLKISNEHHHCELLKIDQQFTAFQIELPFYDFMNSNSFIEVKIKSLSEQLLHGNIYSCKQLRAPPVLFV